MDSDSDSSVELSSSFKNLRGQLRKLDNDLEISIESLKSFRHKVKKIEKYTEQPNIESEYPLLQKYLPIWKKENRLNYNGSKVLLTKKEAHKFHLNGSSTVENSIHPPGDFKTTLPDGRVVLKPLEGWVSVYDICKGLKTN